MSTVVLSPPSEPNVAFVLPLVLHAPKLLRNNEYFFEFCQVNPDWRIERTAQGDIEFMPPTGGRAGNTNATVIILLGIWAIQDGTGKVFDSSTGFVLPNGAVRSPDVSWVLQERLNSLTDEECEKFLPLCPDLVVELKSPTDSLATLKSKMVEYIENGARLGWLIDTSHKQAFVYRPDAEVEELIDPPTLSGEPVLPGFVFDLHKLWTPLK